MTLRFWPSSVDKVDCWVLIGIDDKELVPVEDVWLLIGWILVIISVSTVISIVLGDVAVVEELVELAMTVPDVSIAVTISVSKE